MSKKSAPSPAKGGKFEIRPVLNAPAVTSSVAKAKGNSRKMPPAPKNGRKGAC